MMDVNTLRARLGACGQEHLLQFWETLTAEEQRQLYRDIDE